jgi:hypothetical protein
LCCGLALLPPSLPAGAPRRGGGVDSAAAAAGLRASPGGGPGGAAQGGLRCARPGGGEAFGRAAGGARQGGWGSSVPQQTQATTALTAAVGHARGSGGQWAVCRCRQCGAACGWQRYVRCVRCAWVLRHVLLTGVQAAVAKQHLVPAVVKEGSTHWCCPYVTSVILLVMVCRHNRMVAGQQCNMQWWQWALRMP